MVLLPVGLMAQHAAAHADALGKAMPLHHETPAPQERGLPACPPSAPTPAFGAVRHNDGLSPLLLGAAAVQPGSVQPEGRAHIHS